LPIPGIDRNYGIDSPIGFAIPLMSAGLVERMNVVFMGTNVHSGSAKVLIVQK
jgi:hypothetical protein